MKVRLFCAMMLALVLGSCSSNEEPAYKNAQRTVLIYIVANNTLGDGSWNNIRYDQLDIDEMTLAATKENLNGGRLLVFRDDEYGAQTLNEIVDGKMVQLKQYDGSTSAVTVTRMREVYDDMRSYAPAYNYGLVLWSHASGWLDFGKSPSETTRSWGIDGNYQMSVQNLASALKGQDFDFIWFDCCYMGNIETLYELRGAADYIVASPTEVKLTGMPYNITIPYFFADTRRLITAAEKFFDYYDSMSGDDRSCTITVYNMNYIDDVAQKFKKILARRTTPLSGYTQQIYGVGTPYRSSFYDFVRYVDSLTDNNDETDVELYSEFISAMSKFIVYNANTPRMWDSLTLQYCYGVSSYILKKATDTFALKYNYFELSWYKDITSAYIY